MVKNRGLIPSGPTKISIQRKPLKAIIDSLLPACTTPDLETGVPFRAQAIIANPTAYVFLRDLAMRTNFLWLQLIKHHTDDSDMVGDHHSNSDPLDIDPPVSETVANDLEVDTNKCDSPRSSADGTRKDKASIRLPVPVNENIYDGMTIAEISEAHVKEHHLAQQDRTMERTKEKKNSLESYVYEMRSKLSNTYRSFASEQERDDISRSLQETEDWLYEDGDDETEHAYSSKLEDLKKLLDPIENRYKEEEGRALATRYLLKCILEHHKSADSLPPQDKERMINECNNAKQWLSEKMQQQDSFPKNLDPILWSSDIKSKTEDLNFICQKILESRASPTSE